MKLGPGVLQVIWYQQKSIGRVGTCIKLERYVYRQNVAGKGSNLVEVRTAEEEAWIWLQSLIRRKTIL